MDQSQLLVKNTFLQVDEDSSAHELPRAYSDQSHARKKAEFVVSPKEPIFASIPEDSSEVLESSSSGSRGLDINELHSLRTISRPEAKFAPPMMSHVVPIPAPIAAPIMIGNHKWHPESVSMGTLSSDGKAFTKLEYGGRLSMVTESEVHHSHGIQRYLVYVEEGPVSVADGFGYVFSDTLPCKKNIQKIDSIFISKKGKIGSRVHNEMQILNSGSIGSIEVGSIVEMTIDLDALEAVFSIYQSPRGLDMNTLSILVRNEHSLSAWLVGRSSAIQLAPLVKRTETGEAGYFCAVLKNTSTKIRFL